MTAKKTGEFSGKPGPRSKAHDKHRLELAYSFADKGSGISTALKRACLIHPHGLKPPSLVDALIAVPAHISEMSKIMLKPHLTKDQRADLESEIDRLRKLFESNKPFHDDKKWLADLNLAESPDCDADIEDELGRVRLPRSL